MVASWVSTALIFADERLEQMEDRADAKAADRALIRAVRDYQAAVIFTFYGLICDCKK